MQTTYKIETVTHDSVVVLISKSLEVNGVVENLEPTLEIYGDPDRERIMEILPESLYSPVFKIWDTAKMREEVNLNSLSPSISDKIVISDISKSSVGIQVNHYVNVDSTVMKLSRSEFYVFNNDEFGRSDLLNTFGESYRDSVVSLWESL